MPNGALSDLAKSAAIVYDEDERYRLSKVTVSLDVRDYDPHAEGMDLDAEYMRTEVTKNDFRIQNHGRNATQRPSIVKDGVVYDVIVTLNESDFSPGPYSWRWQYNGVVVSRGGKSAHGIKAIIECRAKFYPEKKCASLASKVFQSLRVKK